MAVQDPGIDIGWMQANTDLSAAQFKAVIVATADFQVILATVVTTPIMGILQNKPTTNQAADIRVVGVSKAVAGASYTRGTALTVDTSGRMITASGTNQVVAIALESAAATGEIRSVYVQNQGQFS